jgi:monomeric isocitrate dehydrogenase
LISSKDTQEIHLLHALFSKGQKVQEIELFARVKALQHNAIRMVRGPVDIGIEIGNLTRNMEDSKEFASLKITDAKLLSMIPLANPINNQPMYQINFGIDGARFGVYR